MKHTDPMIQNVIETAKKNLKEHNELLPTFFVGKADQLNIVGAPFDGGEQGKDAVAMVVRRMAREMEADFVVFVSESWTLPPEHAKDFMENRHKYPNVSDHPHKKEIVMITVETRTTQIMGAADILPNRELGEINWFTEGQYSGRFSHFLGPKPVRH